MEIPQNSLFYLDASSAQLRPSATRRKSSGDNGILVIGLVMLEKKGKKGRLSRFQGKLMR
jgi:hypothetical protein